MLVPGPPTVLLVAQPVALKAWAMPREKTWTPARCLAAPLLQNWLGELPSSRRDTLEGRLQPTVFSLISQRIGEWRL
jgi:hypothetical protein